MGIVSALFEEVPWFRPALAWAVALGSIWLIAAIPAYLVLPYIAAIRSRLALWLQKRRDEWELARIKRSEETRRAIAGLCESRLLWVPRLADEVKAARASLSRVEPEIQRVRERLATFTIPNPSFPALGLPERALEESSATRRAWLNLIIATILLAVVAIVNTGMLSQILKELGVVPANIRLGAIPLFYVFAALLTVIEAGIGFLHGTLSHGSNRDGPTPLRPAALAALLGAVGIAFVEGFFYSQIGEEGRIFKLAEWLTLRHNQIFFIWGAILVMCLFGLGHVFITSAQAIAAGGSVDHLRRRVRRVTKDIHRAEELFRQVGEGFGRATGEADAALEAVRRTKAGEAASDSTSGPLTVADVESIYARTKLWFVIAAGGLVILALIAAVTAIPYWVGLGEGIACFAIGLVLRHEDMTLQSGSRLAAITRRDRIRDAIAVVGLLLVGSLHVYLLRQLTSPRDIVGWLLSAAICGMLVSAGRETAGAFGAVGIGAGSLAARLSNITRFLIQAIGNVALVLVALLETVLSLLAAAITWLRHRREPPIPEVQRAALAK